MRKRVLLLLLFLLPVAAFSQTSPYRVSWPAVPGAGRYRVVVEKLERDWRVVFDFETEALSASLLFDPGEYRYQVTGKDALLELFGEPSRWVRFTVSPPASPAVSPGQNSAAAASAQPATPAASPRQNPAEIAPGQPELPPEAIPAQGQPESPPTSAASPQALPAPAPEPEPAQPEPPPAGEQPGEFLLPAFAAGAGAEINLMDTGKSFAVGCSLTGEWRFSKLFSAGGFFTLSFGKTVPVSMESGVFMRWYFLRFTRMPMELFVEPAVGVAAVLGDAASQNSGGFVDAGLSLGLRFYMGKFYLEPYARGGYPFMGGAGFHLGYASRRP